MQDEDSIVSTYYNRITGNASNNGGASTNGPINDPILQRAVEDIIKKKLMFQASNAQNLYGQIYNKGKS